MKIAVIGAGHWGINLVRNLHALGVLSHVIEKDSEIIDEISKKISELLTPEGTKAEVEIIYQSISDLHASCPDHLGDWYFVGDYPTPGGTKVVNKAFMNYMEGKNKRAY